MCGPFVYLFAVGASVVRHSGFHFFGPPVPVPRDGRKSALSTACEMCSRWGSLWRHRRGLHDCGVAAGHQGLVSVNLLSCQMDESYCCPRILPPGCGSGLLCYGLLFQTLVPLVSHPWPGGCAAAMRVALCQTLPTSLVQSESSFHSELPGQFAVLHAHTSCL